MLIKYIYIGIFTFIFFISAHEEINDVILNENQYSAILALKSINTADTANLDIVWKSDTTFSKISFNDFMSIAQILHKNPDTSYINNKSTYAVCKQLIEKYLKNSKELMQGFQSYTDKENNKFYQQNTQTYFTINFFQLFYAKGSQYVLLDIKIQEALKPIIIGDMILKSMNEKKQQNELVFIAKNSKYNLYNF